MTTTTTAARDRHGEEGAASVMAAIGILVAVLAAVLAIDIGGLALAQRDMQGAVDVAALDAVMALTRDGDPATLADAYARDSLARNDGWSARDGRDIAVTVGTFDEATRTFTPTTVAPDAVLVDASSEFSRVTGVIPGDDLVAHQAIARILEVSSISIGTHAASIDTSRSAFLSEMMSALFAGPVTVDAVGWQGLADARVPLEALQTHFNVGSVSELLDLQVTAPQLLDASAAGLSSSGDPLDVDASTVVGSISSSIGNRTSFRLGDLLTIEQGVPGAVATGSVDALSLVTGTAMIINDEHTVDLGLDLSGIDGIESGTLTLAVIEPPQLATGRPGRNADGTWRTIARTAQVRLGADLVLDPLGEYAGINVGSMQLPLAFDAGRGSAALVDVGCAPDDTQAFARNLVQTTAAGVVYGATTPDLLLTPSPSVVATVRSPLVDLTVDTLLSGEVTVAEVTAGGSYTVPGADEEVTLFGPFTSRARISGSPLLAGVTGDTPGLSALVEDLDLDATVLDASPEVGLTISLDGDSTSVNLTEDVLQPALADAAQVVAQVDGVVSDVSDALGIATVGDADTAATTVDCSGRELVR